MKRIFTVAIFALGLAGCVSRNMNEGLQGLIGQDIHVAVDRLGYPDAQRTVLGDKVYIWSASHNVSLPMTTMSTTTGSVGGAPVYGTTTNTTFVDTNFNCTITLGTDTNGRIKNYRWSGNMGGCEQYARALHLR